jgi:hypothetical protein
MAPLIPTLASRLWIAVGFLWILCHAGLARSTSDEEQSWQGCDIFLAPSTTGWGVYAARSFRDGEMVELAPLFVPMSSDSRQIKQGVLNDYVYGYNTKDGTYKTVVVFGMTMFYNHHPEPNVKYHIVGNGLSHFLAFAARRDISEGEQLFSSYGDVDGGRDWFTKRGMEMQTPVESRISPENLPHFLAECCSKIYAGIGLSTLEDDDHEFIDKSRLAPFDAWLGDARAKVSISNGQRIELSTGLLLSNKLAKDSSLGGLILSWDDLKEEHQSALRILQQTGQIKLQYQSADTSWQRIDAFEQSYEDLAILPVAGNIGLVRRLGDGPSNCRLVLHWQGAQQGSVAVTLELIATQEIAAGEVLTLNLPPAGTKRELALLKGEMQASVQPHYPGIFGYSKHEL